MMQEEARLFGAGFFVFWPTSCTIKGMNIYLAGPLFTLAERRFNEELSAEMQRLCPTLEIFFPQCCDKQFQGLPDFAQRVFQCLMEALDRCDAVVAILDGADADSGTCIEIGHARAKGQAGDRRAHRLPRRRGPRAEHHDGRGLLVNGQTSVDIKHDRQVAEKIVRAINDLTANP